MMVIIILRYKRLFSNNISRYFASVFVNLKLLTWYVKWHYVGGRYLYEKLIVALLPTLRFQQLLVLQLSQKHFKL
jgi:hypothetical protein